MSLSRVIRILVIAGIVATVAYLVAQQGATDREYAVQLQKERDEKDRIWEHGQQSPLQAEDKAKFAGLKYFNPDPEYRIRATMEKLERPEPFPMQLTGNKTEQYEKYALVKFELNGTPQQLYLFRRPAGNTDRSFFVPFTDASNGITSYGGGRYLDVNPVAPLEVELDFNKAYNPYCAYNSEYSCPIPPRENNLQVPVEAGEKAWQPH